MPGIWMIVGTLIWMGVIFFSILIHEYGHAITSRAFGQSPRIELVAFGGLTIPSGPKLPLMKEFIVVLAGPCFGFMLYIGAMILMRFQLPVILHQILVLTAFINLFWTIVNLLPVLPLDGGQLLRIVLEGVFGVKGKHYALITGVVLSLIFALTAFLFGYIILGVLFFLFAFQNFEMSRQAKVMSTDDERDELKVELEKAERSLLEGKNDTAKEHLVRIREQSKDGIIYTCATEYLAQIYFEIGQEKEAYELLAPIVDVLSETSQCLLHELAYDQSNYELVIKLSGPCFQIAPSRQMAEHTAAAYASKGDLKSTLGWLKATLRYENNNINKLLENPVFDQIRSDPTIQSLMN